MNVFFKLTERTILPNAKAHATPKVPNNQSVMSLYVIIPAMG